MLATRSDYFVVSPYFQARIHDESLKYVLSDQAIVALASQPSVSHSEIYSTIAQADINMEMGVNSLIPSLSPVICSHLSDIYHLLANKLDNDDDIYSVILQKCLGQNGSCPLSIFNYALLVNSNLRPTLGYKQPGPKNPKQYSRKASRDLFVQKFSCKSAVYHNCRIYANDGRLLCYCDRRKLEWYLNRDLAKLIDEEPPAIMLLFEPKGRPEDEGNDFYIQIAHAAAEKYKRKVAVEFGIPLYLQRVVHPGQKTEKQIEERAVYPLQLQTAAMALLRHGPRMPLNRHEELTEIINRHYGGREISDEDLERALQVGMTPHERRRFKKKRGTATVTKQDNHAGCTTRMNDLDVDTLKVDAHDGSYGNEKTSEVDRELLMRKDDFENSTLASDIKVNGVVSATPNRNMITVETTYYNGSSDSAVNVDDSCLNSRQENGLGEHNSKLSLLGHGPHGKQVVEDLLKEYGEDGIQAFLEEGTSGSSVYTILTSEELLLVESNPFRNY
ncbi:Exonuclease 3'-5' domain-containing protein 2 [Glycine soja]|nr:Exonuclease 3'-5' domain-containing protein 2 [Glycine soja]